MPMISAMIVMTTSSSTSVNPRCPLALRRIRCNLFPPMPMLELLPHHLADGEQRRHHRDDQAADDDRDEDDRGRSDDADYAIEAALQLRLIEFRDARGEHRQLTR